MIARLLRTLLAWCRCPFGHAKHPLFTRTKGVGMWECRRCGVIYTRVIGHGTKKAKAARRTKPARVLAMRDRKRA